MAFTMERWYSAVGQRFAVRKYKGAPPDDELEQLSKTAETLSARGVRIVLGRNKKAFSPVFLGAGGVKGTDCFAAFISAGADPRTVGYLGETFVLESTALGLGTCWLGIYNKRVVSSNVKLYEGESIVCIAALGIPAEKYAARPRKELDKLTGSTHEELQSLPEWQRFALECARKAPSATNAQPWIFKVDGDNLRVCNTGNNFGYGMLDCGIAMLHMELGAAHGGVAGDWSFSGDDAVFTPARLQE